MLITKPELELLYIFWMKSQSVMLKNSANLLCGHAVACNYFWLSQSKAWVITFTPETRQDLSVRVPKWFQLSTSFNCSILCWTWQKKKALGNRTESFRQQNSHVLQSLAWFDAYKKCLSIRNNNCQFCPWWPCHLTILCICSDFEDESPPQEKSQLFQRRHG